MKMGPGRGFSCALGLVLMIKVLAVSAGNDDEPDEYKPAYGEMMEWSRNDYYVHTTSYQPTDQPLERPQPTDQPLERPPSGNRSISSSARSQLLAKISNCIATHLAYTYTLTFTTRL